MDLALNELLIIEPRLSAGTLGEPVSGQHAPPGVSWAVTARTTPPHLPQLRGRELILVPSRVTAAVESALPSLVVTAAAQGASALVFEEQEAASVREWPALGIPVLAWRGPMPADVETIINRGLTECRGNLYRVGGELERELTEHALGQSSAQALAQVMFDEFALPTRLFDAKGRVVAAAPEALVASRPDERGCEVYVVERELPLGERLVIGPLEPARRIVARFLIDRIAIAAAAALRRDKASRPRGPQRAETTEAILAGRAGSASDQRSAALSLGLDPDAVYFVAVCHGGNEATLTRSLAPLGAVLPAGSANGRRVVLVAASGWTGSESMAKRVAEVKRRWELDHAADHSTLALSAPAVGIASVPAAAREARFVSTLQAQAELPRRAASFESIDDIGALRLLYSLKDSNELRAFVAQALGKLEHRDQRGTLRATLRAFLESGGSQVDASIRLGIHRNTLAYRLRRIGELVGRDVADPTSWLTLHLAIRASEMLDVITDEG